MADKANTAPGNAAPITTQIKFKNMGFLQQLAYIGKATLCICSFGFAFPNIFSD